VAKLRKRKMAEVLALWRVWIHRGSKERIIEEDADCDGPDVKIED
jgi:hypothetical protein